MLELDPADHYARFALGKALQRQGRLAEAHAQYKMAAAMDPRPEYQEALGEVRARMALGTDYGEVEERVDHDARAVRSSAGAG